MGCRLAGLTIRCHISIWSRLGATMATLRFRESAATRRVAPLPAPAGWPAMAREPTKAELYDRCHLMGDIIVDGLGKPSLAAAG